MYVLTLRCVLRPTPSLRPLLRELAAMVVGAVPGLRARHWRVEPWGLCGRYLFDDPQSLHAFSRHPELDPAVERLRAEPSRAPVDIGSIEPVDDHEPVLDRPVFIVSAPRAGSTMLYELLARAGSLWTIDAESSDLLEGIAALHPATRGFDSQRLTAADASPELIRTLRAAFVAELRDRRGRRYLELPAALRPARVRLLDKSPEASLRIPLLHAAFPDARFVLLHRNARQSISSIIDGWRHGGFVSLPQLPGWPGGSWCFLLPPGWRALAGRSRSDVAAFQWYAANERALDDLAAVPVEAWTSVEYAELVAAAPEEVRRLCAWIGIPIDPPLADAASRPLPLSSTTISPPSPIKWRSNPELEERSYANMGPLMGRLRSLGTPATPPRSKPVSSKAPRYACPLEPLGAELPDGEGWIVDPACHVQIGATVPLPVVRRAPHRDRFVADQPIVWAEDPATRVLYPFWARREDAWILRHVQPGRRPPRALPRALAGQLVRAGALVRAEAQAQRGAVGEAMVARAAAQLASQHFCHLPGLLHPGHVEALAHYYRRLVATGQWGVGDDQVERRHGWYDEAIARYFHAQLRDVIGRIAGEPIKPTYAYVSAYHGGAALRAHMDRQQCELTVSLLVDDTPGTDPLPWPLWFQGALGRVSLTLVRGDAVLFRGCDLPHWREAAPEDRHQTMLLFHYVPESFVGSLD